MTQLKNAMYNVLLRKDSICCLCFEAVETNAIRIDDEVLLNEKEIAKNMELSGVLAFIFESEVGDLASETVCKECATSAINCYLFIKKCKENSKHFQQAIESLDNCLQNATDPEQIQSCKSLFVSLDASNVAKEYYDYRRPVTNPSVILKRFKFLSRNKLANYYLQSIKNEDDFDADIETPIVTQDASKLIICEKETTITHETDPISRDLTLHKDSAFRCKSCLKPFNLFNSLKRHYLSIHAPKTFKCSKCECSYGSCKLLEKHLKKCTGKKAPIPKELILHEDSKPLSYKCKSCLKTFIELKNLRTHYMCVHAPKTFKCSKCERCYGSFRFLKAHLKTCSGTPPIPRDLSILHEDSEPSEYKCKSCLRTHKDFRTLKDHYMRVHAPKTFKCSKCEHSYGSYSFLKTHLKLFHVTCVCTVCGKTFNNTYSLKQHELGHILRFVCQECGRVYKNRNSFKSHKESGVCGQTSRKSPNKGLFECDICKKRFSHKNAVRNHIKAEHSDTGKPFDCSWCDKKFSSQSRLKEHVRTHTQEKNFSCEICGGKFVTKSSLLYHTRIHTGEKPYECSACGERFLNTSRRARHFRYFHTDEMFNCDVCSAKYKDRSSLTQHKKKHCNTQSTLLKVKIKKRKSSC